MNVIIFDRFRGRAREINLAQPKAIAVLTVAVLLVVGGAFLAGHHLGLRSASSQPSLQAAEWSKRLATQQAQLAETRRVLQDHIDALAKRVGQMNAHVIRLDALGRRLTQMADIDEREFDFGNPPAQGGPETDGQGEAAQIPDLTAMIDGLSRQMDDREVELGVLENLILSRNLNEQIKPKGRPVTDGWISSYFGSRSDPFTGYTAVHKGVDFAGRAGAQVVAVATGVVTWSRERFGYGKMVEINHGNGFVTRYAHNERNLVSVGETVQKGQPIALMGSTGRATGPNLHFEVLRNGRQVNPLQFVDGR
ncbi:MAG TPA: M23 family metallopeptidase [Steroidobacteraceae bacterium]|jgi:murein DD-endopeptidase MepM/ murein hydrolase activator NlpD|nr:M23 family metallopeptidase [Steroidobacteraceae bacterium]